MCKHKTLAFLGFALFVLLINQAYALNWNFPEDLTIIIPDGMKWYFGDYSFNTSGTDAYITSWFRNSQVSYNVDNAGTQEVYYPYFQPSTVYIDGVEKAVGDGWIYAAGTTTITNAASSVILFYGPLIHVAVASSYLVYGENITILVESSGILNFKGVYGMDVEVTSGLWNASAGNLGITRTGGSLVFNAENDSSLEFSTDADRRLQLTVNGAYLTQNKQTNIHTLTMTSGSTVSIVWRFLAISIIDNYFMLGVGLAGIILMVAAPTWWAMLFINKGLGEESVERIGYSMLLFILGFGFTVIWLWQ